MVKANPGDLLSTMFSYINIWDEYFRESLEEIKSPGELLLVLDNTPSPVVEHSKFLHSKDYVKVVSSRCTVGYIFQDNCQLESIK